MGGNNIKDYYYILGLARSASTNEIKSAYRKLSLKFHPDQNNGDKFFEERFKEIQEAYDTLSDEGQRRLYDAQLNAGNTANTQYATEPVSPVIPVRKKNKLKQTLYGFIALIVFSSPAWLKPLVHKLNEEEQASNAKKDAIYEAPVTNVNNNESELSQKDTSNNDVVLLKMIYDSAETSDADNPATINKNATDPPVDDEGFTARDVLDRFFAALTKKDCHTAWDQTYVTSWVTRGEDWFCSSDAFGTITGMMVYEISPVETENTRANFYAEYYAEDSYNGNKCFKQLIFLQKLEYTDGKWRWKISRIRNNATPTDCDGF